MCNVQLLQRDMRTPALVARVVSSIIVLFLSFSLSLALALAASRYIATCGRSFLNFSFVRVDLSDRSRLLRECIVSSASSLCVYGLFLLCGPREQMCVLLCFFVKSATRVLSLARSLAKRTKKREEYSSRLRTSAFFNRRHIRRVHRHAKKLNLTYFRLRRIALIRFYEQRDRSNIFK